MVNKSIDLPETINCTGKGCEFAIPVLDCFYVHNAEVPQIGVKCPECGKVVALSRTKSIAYAEAYPQIQQGIDSAVGFRSPEPEEHESLADRVLRLLDVYGYTQSKWTGAKKIIRQLIENTPGPHTIPTVNEILTSRSIKQVDAFQIANLAIGGENQSAMGVSGIFTPQQQLQQPGMYPTQMPYQQPIGQPQMPYQQQMQQPAYQYPQQMPPQMPYQQPQPAPPSATDDDGITIIEKLGEDGQVIERVIKQPKPVDAPTDGTAPPANVAEQLKDVIDVMNESGMLRSTEPEPQPTVEDIIEHIAPLLERSEPDDRYDKLSGEISSLKDLIGRSEKDKLNARFDSIEASIASTGKAGMSDSQHSDVIRKDIETARIDALSNTLDRVVKPIIEMQATQAKFQTMMMVRQVEQQDHAAPGTYVQMFAPTTVSDESVQTDLGKWRSRAGRSGATA